MFMGTNIKKLLHEKIIVVKSVFIATEKSGKKVTYDFKEIP